MLTIQSAESFRRRSQVSAADDFDVKLRRRQFEIRQPFDFADEAADFASRVVDSLGVDRRFGHRPFASSPESTLRLFASDRKAGDVASREPA